MEKRRISRHTEKPSSFGSMMSRMTRSNCDVRALATASSPSKAVSTSKPSRSKLNFRISAMGRSSSTTRMRSAITSSPSLSSSTPFRFVSRTFLPYAAPRRTPSCHAEKIASMLRPSPSSTRGQTAPPRPAGAINRASPGLPVRIGHVGHQRMAHAVSQGLVRQTVEARREFRQGVERLVQRRAGLQPDVARRHLLHVLGQSLREPAGIVARRSADPARSG